MRHYKNGRALSYSAIWRYIDRSRIPKLDIILTWQGFSGWPGIYERIASSCRKMTKRKSYVC